MKLDQSLWGNYTTVGTSGPAVDVLNFTIQKQLMSNWCWAAVTESINNFYKGTPISQASIVAKVIDKPICALGKPIPLCNEMADLSYALNSVGHLKTNLNNALSPIDTANCIANGNPLGCQLYLPSLGGGHVVVIYGTYQNNHGTMMLCVADPKDSAQLVMPYKLFLNNYRGIGGQWVRSYITR